MSVRGNGRRFNVEITVDGERLLRSFESALLETCGAEDLDKWERLTSGPRSGNPVPRGSEPER